MKGRLGLALLLCLMLIGCGEEPGGFRPYEAGGQLWAPKEEVTDFPAEWGDVLAVSSHQDCAFDATVTTYEFAALTLRTRETDGVEILTDLELRPGSLPTPEGLSVGDRAERVMVLYGAGEERNAYRLYRQDDVCLQIFLRDGRVAGIRYLAV